MTPSPPGRRLRSRSRKWQSTPGGEFNNFLLHHYTFRNFSFLFRDAVLVCGKWEEGTGEKTTENKVKNREIEEVKGEQKGGMQDYTGKKRIATNWNSREEL